MEMKSVKKISNMIPRLPPGVSLKTGRGSKVNVFTVGKRVRMSGSLLKHISETGSNFNTLKIFFLFNLHILTIPNI